MAAVAVLTAAAGWSWLSVQFVYGEGHADRPILPFLALYALAWVPLLALARGRVLAGGPRPAWIVAVALAARLLLLPSQLIQENDVYRYVLDGQVVLAGENPYRYSPEELPLIVYHPLAEELDTPPARQVLDRIGYPEVPTVYPPAAQAAFALGSWWGGWDWRGQRLVFLLCDLATILLLWRLLPAAGAPAQALALYAWNPLVLKEVVNSAHLDALTALAVLGAAALLLGEGRRTARTALTALLLALAVLSKLYPVVLLPAFAVFVARRWGWARAFLLAAAVPAAVALGYLPFLDAGPGQLFAGLHTYGSQWRMNEGLFSLLALLPGNPRVLAAGLAVLAALLVPLVRRADADGLLGGLQWILLIWFLLLPAAFPWYALPLLALSPLRPAAAVSRTAWVLSGVASAYYLSFYVSYRELDAFWWQLARTVEYGILFASLAWFCRARVDKAAAARGY